MISIVLLCRLGLENNIRADAFLESIRQYFHKVGWNKGRDQKSRNPYQKKLSDREHIIRNSNHCVIISKMTMN